MTINTYTKYLTINYFKSICYVFVVILSLVIILNILTEIEFLKSYDVIASIPFYLSILNSLDLVFEMFPFIFLLATQIFFINLSTDNQINIFKYSGLKNSKILVIISLFTFFLGILIITFFYSLSSNLKNLYLEHKNRYSLDNKYLAVVTNNGLWIKDVLDKKTQIINANKIENNFLINVNISEFDQNFNLVKIISSKKVNIDSNNWILNNVKIIENNNSKELMQMQLFSNFDFEKINSLFSNLSALSILELFELRNNYMKINYSTTEIDIQLLKLFSYPIYFTLMTIFSAIIMLNIKKFKSNSLKITIGLFTCVVIFYMNNFFQVLGTTEKIPTLVSVWMPILIVACVNSILVLKINEK
jgi:lipopolysaccharide export system permease protein